MLFQCKQKHLNTRQESVGILASSFAAQCFHQVLPLPIEC